VPNSAPRTVHPINVLTARVRFENGPAIADGAATPRSAAVRMRALKTVNRNPGRAEKVRREAHV